MSSFEITAGIANGTDLTDNVNVGYTTNGWSLINTSPYYFVRSGRVDGTTLCDFTAVGLYWSSTAVSNQMAYYLFYRSDGLYPAGLYYRDYGFSLRCVAKLIV